MPTLANTSTDLSTLKIHKFPSMDAFNAAVGNSQIGTTDISFVAGDTSDVPLPTAQDVGNVLTAGASGLMYWGAGGGSGGGATALNELSDVNLVNALASGQVLTFNGSTWLNQILGINDLRDVTISGASEGQILTYINGTGWTNTQLPASEHDLTYEVLSPTTNTLTLTFASKSRGYKYIDIGNIGASTLNLTLVINNNAENYIMFNNHSQSARDINIQSVQHNGVTNSNIYSSAIVPADDSWHTVNAERCKEMSINVIPTTHKIIITTTDDMEDRLYM